jgi:hypothetical protein
LSWPAQVAGPVTSGLAVTALVLSILWIGGVGSLSALIFGLVALSQIRSSGGRTRGKGLATAGVVIGIVGIVGAIVLYSTAGVVTSPPRAALPKGGAGTSHGPPAVTASPGVVRDVTTVAPSVIAAVGVPPQSVVVPPTVATGQPPLVVDGKPGAVFVGGVFCPYCAAERWAMIVAFSRFGTFSHLRQTTSSPWDVFPSTPTFSFQGATYRSRYVGFATVEHSGNDVDGAGTNTELEPLTAQEASLWQKYDNSQGYPFLDIGNKAFVLTPSFTPGLLAGLDQQIVAGRLTRADSPTTQAIVGAANYLTAAICATTDQKPASVCATTPVVKAGQAMHLGGGASLTARVGSAKARQNF